MKKGQKEMTITLGMLKKLKIPVSKKMLQDKVDKGEAVKGTKDFVYLEGKAIAKGIIKFLTQTKIYEESQNK